MRVLRGVPERCRGQAARLYYEAFEAQLNPIIGDHETGLPLLREGIRLDFALAALDASRLVGLAGTQTVHGQFANIRPFDLVQTFGLWAGLGRVLLGHWLSHAVSEGDFWVDGIAVAPEWRGRGVGTALLTTLFTTARSEGYRSVRLEVVDTNRAARRLYERLGFVARKERRTGWITRSMGHDAIITMVKSLY